MLQSVRDNLKGTVVSAVIILFFVLPMVVTGVGSSWLGSVAGTDAAKVDDRTISKVDLGRAIYNFRQTQINQGRDPSDESLTDENLRAPVLERLTNREAMLSAADEGGMGMSESALNSIIVTMPEFQADGKFDPQIFRNVMARNGMSPARFRQVLADDMILNQLNSGLDQSSFVTEKEIKDLIAIIHEKRSFYTIDIGADTLEEKVSVSEDEIESYYESNQAQFLQPETVSISYIELSVDSLAENMPVSDAEIQAQFQSELDSFDPTPEYKIAHILIKQSKEAPQKLVELQEKISAGEDFAELAKTYSEDAGSKDLGGSLGVMVSGVFPEEFEAAVLSLDEGQVSAPVETDAGTHLIKVQEKIIPEPPSFEDRKDALVDQIKTAKAESQFLANLELMEELSFDAPDLEPVAAELAVDVQQSEAFERTNGTGIAANPAIRSAAFEPEVLDQGLNSPIVELSGNRAVVLRVKDHTPEFIQPLEVVHSDIEETVRTQKVTALLEEKAQALIASIKEGSDPEDAASKRNYTFEGFELASRSDPVSDPSTRGLVFSAPVVEEGDTVFETKQNADGSFRLIGITDKQPGSMDSVDEMQLSGISSQLKRENGRFEGGIFQSATIDSADIEIY